MSKSKKAINESVLEQIESLEQSTGKKAVSRIVPLPSEWQDGNTEKVTVTGNSTVLETEKSVLSLIEVTTEGYEMPFNVSTDKKTLANIDLIPGNTYNCEVYLWQERLYARIVA